MVRGPAQTLAQSPIESIEALRSSSGELWDELPAASASADGNLGEASLLKEVSECPARRPLQGQDLLRASLAFGLHTGRGPNGLHVAWLKHLPA